jgi:Cu(I)/Ag(I) efflux system membrane fusion protein
MHPEQHFDKPGKSPSMNMDLVPRLAGEEKASVKIDPSVVQDLGVRLAKVERIPLSSRVEVSGLIGFDERNVAIVQALAGGFVEKVPPLAPGDVVRRGDALAVLSIPEWTSAENEFLAVLESHDPSLEATARERLRLLGIPGNLVAELEKDKMARSGFVMRSPVSGVIQSLDIRLGMSVSGGETLARINGLSTVWLDAAVPQAMSVEVHAGDRVKAFISGHEKTVSGKVEAVLPALDESSRSLKVRIAFPNPELRLRPGASARVEIGHDAEETALAVPTEAVIRTGKRTLVMVAEGVGKFSPVEVKAGREIGDKTVISSGLSENQEIASSGQFLIDSEASLSGVMIRSQKSGMDEADATIVGLSGNQVTLSHGPFRALGMPGMTTTFSLANPDVAKGLKAGEKVHVMVHQNGDGPVVTKMETRP